MRLDQPQVVGIVNVTPDSFSDGGRFADAAAAIEAGHDMAAAGAAIVDVGGESTRPGAKPVWEGDETERVLPVIRRLAGGGDRGVDRHAQGGGDGAGARRRRGDGQRRLGADLGPARGGGRRQGRLPGRADAPPGRARRRCRTIPRYDRPVLLEVYDWLEARIAAAEAAGIARERIIVDPGFGFGKNVQHNLQLMNGLALLHGLGCPIMLGASRKRTIGALVGRGAGRPAARRLARLALKAAEQGVQLLRVHDVPETVQALRVWRGLRDAALTPG